MIRGPVPRCNPTKGNAPWTTDVLAVIELKFRLLVSNFHSSLSISEAVCVAPMKGQRREAVWPEDGDENEQSGFTGGASPGRKRRGRGSFQDRRRRQSGRVSGIGSAPGVGRRMERGKHTRKRAQPVPSDCRRLGGSGTL